jgi:hypothetical protein
MRFYKSASSRSFLRGVAGALLIFLIGINCSGCLLVAAGAGAGAGYAIAKSSDQKHEEQETTVVHEHDDDHPSTSPSD